METHAKKINPYAVKKQKKTQTNKKQWIVYKKNPMTKIPYAL